MQNIALQHGARIRARGELALPLGDDGGDPLRRCVRPRRGRGDDVALAREVRRDVAHAHGSFRLSGGGLAKILGETLGRAVRYRALDPADVERSPASTGLPSFLVDSGLRVYEHARAGLERATTNDGAGAAGSRARAARFRDLRAGKSAGVRGRLTVPPRTSRHRSGLGSSRGRGRELGTAALIGLLSGAPACSAPRPPADPVVVAVALAPATPPRCSPAPSPAVEAPEPSDGRPDCSDEAFEVARASAARSLAAGALEDAVAGLERAASLRPTHPGTRQELVRLLHARGQVEGAAGHARVLVEVTDGGDALAWHLLGLEAERNGQKEEARAFFARAALLKYGGTLGREARNAIALHGRRARRSDEGSAHDREGLARGLRGARPRAHGA